MKLGELQTNKPFKFLQEEILEGVWPLSKFRAPINIYLLIAIYVIWGFGLFLLYPIPNFYIIAGSISAIGISIWTLGIVNYANSLRNIELDELKTSMTYKKISLEFMDNLFHNSSLFYGVAIAVVVYTIILNSAIIRDDVVLNRYFGNIPLLVSITDRTSLLANLQNSLGVSSIPIPILMYIFFISFDISYRVGLSFHILLTQARRNWLFFRTLRKKELRQNLEKKDLQRILNTDKYHYLALSGGIFLIPLTLIDVLFRLCLLGVIVFVFVMATFNFLSLRFIINKYFSEADQ